MTEATNPEPATPLEATDRIGIDGVLAALNAVRELGHDGGLTFQFTCDVCHGYTSGTNKRCNICLGHEAKGWAWDESNVRWVTP